MATQAQIAANRLNAQRSTGPRTPSGKALASQNSLKHGLSAHRDVITTESQEEYDRHRDALLTELNPQTPMESMLADRIVSLSWRLKRADLIQNQTIDALTEKDATNPLAKIAKSLGLNGLGLLQPNPADSNPDLILGRIALKDFSNERVLDRLLMYERRIEHSLFKTLLELQRLRLLRTLKPSASSFSRRRNDDALAPAPVPPVTTEPNNTPSGIPIRPDPIINNKSSIVTIENPPTPLPASPDTSQGPLTGLHVAETPFGASRNIQNEPNSNDGATFTTSCTPNTYANFMPCPTRRKRTQTNPTCRGVASGEAGFIAAMPPANQDFPPCRGGQNRYNGLVIPAKAGIQNT